MDDSDAALMEESAGARLGLIAESFRRVAGRPLVDGTGDPAALLWRAPRVILAHGTEDDPLFFYANRLATELFEVPAAAFIGMPSRLSAEAPERAERARFLERVARDGFVADYAGIRIARSGRRFRIEQALVWNLVDGAGRLHGQAATFDRWTDLS